MAISAWNIFVNPWDQCLNCKSFRQVELMPIQYFKWGCMKLFWVLKWDQKELTIILDFLNCFKWRVCILFLFKNCFDKIRLTCRETEILEVYFFKFADRAAASQLWIMDIWRVDLAWSCSLQLYQLRVTCMAICTTTKSY